METTRAERVRLGIFIVATLTLVLGTVAFILGKAMIERNTPYYSRFTESVDGLNLGAKVKLNGILVGQVTRIVVDSTDMNLVLVEYEINSDIAIKTGMEANLVGGISLTGLKTIELTGGSIKDENIESGGQIKSGASGLSKITNQAEVLAQKTEIIMNNLINMTSDQNVAHLSEFLSNMNNISARADALLDKNESQINAVAPTALQVLNSANSTIAKIEEAVLSFEKVIKNGDIEKTLAGVQEATKSFEMLAKRTDQTVYRNQEDISIAIRHLREAMENLNDLSRQVRENPSLLIRGEEKQQRVR